MTQQPFSFLICLLVNSTVFRRKDIIIFISESYFGLTNISHVKKLLKENHLHILKHITQKLK